MFYRWLLSLSVVTFVSLPTFAQPVISARAGLIQLTDGSVFLDNQRLEPRAARFPQMEDGSELRTENGRAEILLTPGVFLRMGNNSSIRMISNRLADARVRFLDGSATVDAMDGSPSTAVTIVYSDYTVRIGGQGRYRFNANPAELKVDAGEAKVLMDGKSVAVRAGSAVPFSADLTARKFDRNAGDDLDDWTKSRNDSVARNNLDAANTPDLGGVIDDWQNDRAAYMEALGMSSYIPPTPLSAYSAVAGSPILGVTPYGLYGMGYASPLGFYPLFLSGYYGLPYSSYRTGIGGYRSPFLFPTRIGSGTGIRMGTGIRTGTGVRTTPMYGAPRVTSSPIHVSPGRVGGGVGHVGAGHR